MIHGPIAAVWRSHWWYARHYFCAWIIANITIVCWWTSYQWWSLSLRIRDRDRDLIIRDRDQDLTIRDRDHPSETKMFGIWHRDRDRIYFNFLCLYFYFFFSFWSMIAWSVRNFSSGLVVSIEKSSETKTFESPDRNETETFEIRDRDETLNQISRRDQVSRPLSLQHHTRLTDSSVRSPSTGCISKKETQIQS